MSFSWSVVTNLAVPTPCAVPPRPDPTLPFPVPDPDRVYGGQCDSCKGACAGHYKVSFVDVSRDAAIMRA